MRLFRRILLAVLVVILGIAIYQTLLWFGVWGDPNESQIRKLEGDDQEIALIEPATSTDDWGRFVTAINLLQADWPRLNPAAPALNVSLVDAFPLLTADVPEIVLSLGASKQRLRLRWYKISGEHDAASWLRKLNARARAPLAIIGGGTSDRAVRLARALQATYPDAEQASPAFLITTATSEKTAEEKPLILEYDKRSFRFSFTNQKMVDALLKFVKQTPNLWVNHPPEVATVKMHSVVWQDERYSQDLSELFQTEFKKTYRMGEFIPEGTIPHAIGDFFRPAPLEQAMVGTFLAEQISPRSFLVLPTGAVRMRRFLINLWQRSPKDARNLVILNGDAISFNSVYRDRDVMWNILDLPYSLVFFAHRNPIDAAAGFTKDERDEALGATPQRTTTGTHDVLLNRDIVEAILYAAYDRGGKLSGDALKFRAGLRATCWHQAPKDSARVYNTKFHEIAPEPRRFFTTNGDRRRETGEHIVWVKPNFTEDRVDLTSQISVWSMLPDTKGGAWQLVEPAFDARYNENR